MSILFSRYMLHVIKETRGHQFSLPDTYFISGVIEVEEYRVDAVERIG